MTFSTPGLQLLAAALAAFLSTTAANDEAPRAGIGLRGLRRDSSDRNEKSSNKDKNAKHDICGPVLATFDSSLQTPRCFSAGSACLSGALLNGKSNNGEPNGDNTLDSCADGSDGTYHGDESIDHISVSVVGEEGDLRSGSTALIEATVWAREDGSEDTADFYYAADAHDPSWVFIGSRRPSGGGRRTLAVQYRLPAGSLQAVRVNFRRRGQQGGVSGSCSGGRHDDVDDLVFSVSASDGGASAA